MPFRSLADHVRSFFTSTPCEPEQDDPKDVAFHQYLRDYAHELEGEVPPRRG